MAKFRSYKYKSDDGDVYLLRMRVDLFDAIPANAEATEDVTKPFHIESSDSRRSFGIKPRYIVATRSFGTGVDSGTKSIRVPILQTDVIDGEAPTINVRDVITYGGKAWSVSSLVGETQR